MTDPPFPPLASPAAKKVKSDSEPSEVVPDVFLGSIGAAHNREVLERLGITHILTVAGGFEPKFPESLVYECVDEGRAEERLCVHFDRCLKFIAKCLLDGAGAGHCFAEEPQRDGACAAYVMATRGCRAERRSWLPVKKAGGVASTTGSWRSSRASSGELARARTEGRLLGRVQLDARRARASKSWRRRAARWARGGGDA